MQLNTFKTHYDLKPFSNQVARKISERGITKFQLSKILVEEGVMVRKREKEFDSFILLSSKFELRVFRSNLKPLQSEHYLSGLHT